MRRADEVIGAGRRRLLVGGAFGLLDFFRLETAAPDPHHCDKARLFFLGHAVDEGAQFRLGAAKLSRHEHDLRDLVNGDVKHGGPPLAHRATALPACRDPFLDLTRKSPSPPGAEKP
jgi:hypothetical protein